jgi:hypothetical protein
VLDQEIANRLGVISGLVPYNDSIAYESGSIHKGSQKFLLLSKDVENKHACVAGSNDFFKKLAVEHGVSPGKLLSMNVMMDADEMEIVLKENELLVLNQVIFNNSGADIRLFSVHDEND